MTNVNSLAANWQLVLTIRRCFRPATIPPLSLSLSSPPINFSLHNCDRWLGSTRLNPRNRSRLTIHAPWKWSPLKEQLNDAFPAKVKGAASPVCRKKEDAPSLIYMSAFNIKTTGERTNRSKDIVTLHRQHNSAEPFRAMLTKKKKIKVRQLIDVS